MKNATAYLDNNGNGFVLGGKAQIVPQVYVDRYNQGELEERSVTDFSRVINRTNIGRLMNMAPAHARVTEAGTLIID